MDSKQIKFILEKYWEGETSLQEERNLREYFARDDVPEDLKKIQPLFQFLQEEQTAYLNGDFEERLSEQLRRRDNQMPRRARIVRMLGRAAAVAAIFLAVAFAYSTWDRGSATKPALTAGKLSELNNKEQAEALLAYEEAKAALMLVSKKMKKGTGKAEEGIVQVRKATKVIR